MITAKEARALTNESVKNLTVQKYEPLIRKAAEEGCTSISFDHVISELEKEALREFGYKVQERDVDYYNSDITIIAW